MLVQSIVTKQEVNEYVLSILRYRIDVRVELLQPLRSQFEANITPSCCAACKIGSRSLGYLVAITLVTLGGFGMVFSVVMELIANGINLSPGGMVFSVVMELIANGINLSPGGMVLIFFCLLVILAIVGLLVRQLSRVLSMSQLSGDAPAAQKPNLGEKPVQQISPAREPASSVTDHTTRTFEPLHRERDTQR